MAKQSQVISENTKVGMSLAHGLAWGLFFGGILGAIFTPPIAMLFGVCLLIPIGSYFHNLEETE